MDKLLSTEINKIGEIMCIKLANPMGNSRVLPIFLQHQLDLINVGHAPSILIGSNKGLCIYATIDDIIVGFIAYSYLDDHTKTAWITLGSVVSAHRKKGIYSIMHKQLEILAKKAGSTKITSLVHVDNIAMIELNKKLGKVPSFYKCDKDI